MNIGMSNSQAKILLQAIEHFVDTKEDLPKDKKADIMLFYWRLYNDYKHENPRGFT